jgi:hypothetical protein
MNTVVSDTDNDIGIDAVSLLLMNIVVSDIDNDIGIVANVSLDINVDESPPKNIGIDALTSVPANSVGPITGAKDIGIDALTSVPANSTVGAIGADDNVTITFPDEDTTPEILTAILYCPV